MAAWASFLAIMDHTLMDTGIIWDKAKSNEFLPILPWQRHIAYDKYSELVSRIIVHVATEQERDLASKFEAEQPEKCQHCGGLVRRQSPPFRIVHDIANCRRRPS